MHLGADRLSIAVIAVLFLFAIGARAQQCPVMPVGFLCITQEAANAAAANARELVATKEKAAVLEAALAEKDKNTDEIREAARKNEAELKDRLHQTEVELANKTGQLIGAEASITRCLAVQEVLLKFARPKKIGLFNLF